MFFKVLRQKGYTPNTKKTKRYSLIPESLILEMGCLVLNYMAWTKWW